LEMIHVLRVDEDLEGAVHLEFCALVQHDVVDRDVQRVLEQRRFDLVGRPVQDCRTLELLVHLDDLESGCGGRRGLRGFHARFRRGLGLVAEHLVALDLLVDAYGHGVRSCGEFLSLLRRDGYSRHPGAHSSGRRSQASRRAQWREKSGQERRRFDGLPGRSVFQKTTPARRGPAPGLQRDYFFLRRAPFLAAFFAPPFLAAFLVVLLAAFLAPPFFTALRAPFLAALRVPFLAALRAPFLAAFLAPPFFAAFFAAFLAAFFAAGFLAAFFAAGFLAAGAAGAGATGAAGSSVMLHGNVVSLLIGCSSGW